MTLLEAPTGAEPEFDVVGAPLARQDGLPKATGSARFLGIVLRGQALLQAAVLVALIWINLSFNLETEVRRLNDLSQERSRDTHVE